MDPVRVPVLSGRHHRRRYPAETRPTPYGLSKTLLPGPWLRVVSTRGFRGSTTARRAGQTVGGNVPGAIRPQREARMGAMPDTMQPAPLPSAYQLRVVVRGVSPLIWRRLLVPADTTIAGLHAVLQIAFGWTGTHLHRFVVQGREYGTGYVGGPQLR